MGRATFGGPVAAGLRAEHKHTASYWLCRQSSLLQLCRTSATEGLGWLLPRALHLADRVSESLGSPMWAAHTALKVWGAHLPVRSADLQTATGRPCFLSQLRNTPSLPMNSHPNWHCCHLTCGDFLLVCNTSCYQGDYWKTQLFLF